MKGEDAITLAWEGSRSVEGNPPAVASKEVQQKRTQKTDFVQIIEGRGWMELRALTDITHKLLLL